MGWFGFGKKQDTAAPEDRLQNEIRLSDAQSWSDAFDVGSGSIAGPVVNSETAMKATAVFACVRVLAGAIQSLPLDVKNVNGEPLPHAHNMWKLLNEAPSDLHTSAVFREAFVSDMCTVGDGIALLDRTYGGDTLGVYHVPSNAISVTRQDGRLKYAVPLSSGFEVFDQDDVLHVPFLGMRNNRGLSPIQYARESIGLALSGAEYAGRFFSNGGMIGGYLTFPSKVGEEQAHEIRDYWMRKHQGLANAHKPAVLSEGGEYKNITLSAEDAQLLQQREFQVADICRIFGVPPWMVGAMEKTTSWGTGMEQMFTSFVILTLTPHLTRIEQEITRKIGRGYKVDFDTKGLLRGDTKTRFEAHKSAIGGNQLPGFMTVNEVRAAEGLQPIEGGDGLYRPLTGDSKSPTENTEENGDGQ